MSKRKKQARNTRGIPAWMVSGCVGKYGRDSFQKYRDRGFYSGPTASPVRRIDPVTGDVVKDDPIEILASEILRADRSKGGRKPRREKIKAKKRNKRKVPPSVERKNEFYKSWEWRTLRMEVLKERGRTCECCGATPADKTPSGEKVRIVVDHIKPISLFWNLRLTKSNLQVLCDECNQGKGNWDQTDYRSEIFETTDNDPLTAEYRKIVGSAA